jgi:hypothetical protein
MPTDSQPTHPIVPEPQKCGKNRRAAPCGHCKRVVLPGDGDLYKGATSWVVYHSGPCHSVAGPGFQEHQGKLIRMKHEGSIDAGELVAAFVRARFVTVCRACGGRIAIGEEIHWSRDARGTVVSHAGTCPQKATK